MSGLLKLQQQQEQPHADSSQQVESQGEEGVRTAGQCGFPRKTAIMIYAGSCAVCSAMLGWLTCCGGCEACCPPSVVTGFSWCIRNPAPSKDERGKCVKKPDTRLKGENEACDHESRETEELCTDTNTGGEACRWDVTHECAREKARWNTGNVDSSRLAPGLVGLVQMEIPLVLVRNGRNQNQKSPTGSLKRWQYLGLGEKSRVVLH